MAKGSRGKVLGVCFWLGLVGVSSMHVRQTSLKASPAISNLAGISPAMAGDRGAVKPVWFYETKSINEIANALRGALGTPNEYVKKRAKGEVVTSAQTLLDVNAYDEHGLTGLMWAAQTGNTELCKLLLQYGADPNAYSKDGNANTALHIACMIGDAVNSYGDQTNSFIIVKLLLDAKAHVDARNFLYRTPFQTASFYIFDYQKRYPICELLHQYGADVNAQDIYGYTALHLATLFIDEPWVYFFRKTKYADLVNPLLRDRAGLTATEEGHLAEKFQLYFDNGEGLEKMEQNWLASQQKAAAKAR